MRGKAFAIHQPQRLSGPGAALPTAGGRCQWKLGVAPTFPWAGGSGWLGTGHRPWGH